MIQDCAALNYTDVAMTVTLSVFENAPKIQHLTFYKHTQISNLVAQIVNSRFSRNIRKN